MIKLECLPTHKIDVSSEFGQRDFAGLTFHNGIDLRPMKAGKKGDDIKSVANGKVMVAKVDGAGLYNGFGKYIVIDHNGWCTLYAHLDYFNCAVGDTVKAGQVIGYMGNTGLSTGVHLHFEIREIKYGTEFFKKQGDRAIYSINPRPYLEEVVMDKESAKKILMSKVGLSEDTIKYLDFYRYGDDLIIKLAKALNK